MQTIKRIALLGSSKALKPTIIVKTIIEMDLMLNREILIFTDNDSGVFYDYCVSQGIKMIIYKNTSFDDKFCEELAVESKADILISAGWPKIIPVDFLNLFKYTPINCHGSILPDYRGSRAYMHYWANCSDYYGATIHYMNENFDDGNIIIQGRYKLFIEESPKILHQRTAELSAFLLPTAISLVETGFQGYSGKGLTRYFYKLSHEKFTEYREFNISVLEKDRKLTPHKIIKH